MLFPLNRPLSPAWLRRLRLGLFLLLLLSACRQTPPQNLETLIRAMPAPEPAGREPFPGGLLERRVNLQGQIRSALAPAPGQGLPLPTPTGAAAGPVRFAVGLLPQYWEQHPGPVRFRIQAGGQTLWEKVLDPARDLSQRGWQEVGPISLPATAPASLLTDAADFGALVTAPQWKPAPAGPSVIFILVDALRPDHLGAYGYSRPTSPNLDRLAARGVRFENAITASAFTLTSVATIFTGRYPWEHGVIFTRGLHLPPELPVLAEAFEQAGYATAAFSGTYFRFSLEGFDRGFEVFDESCAQDFFRGSAECLSRAVLPWLEAHGDEPFFLYLHYVDTHAPYYAAEPFRHRFTAGLSPDRDAAGLGDAARFGPGRKWFQWPLTPTAGDVEYLKALYDGEIAYADAAIGQVFQALAAAGRLDATLILATADHGEAFFEHGMLEHDRVLYDEALKVPLLLAGPGLPAGKAVQEQVRTLDFSSTLLDLAGLGREGWGRGISLRPLWEGRAFSPEPAVAAIYRKGNERRLALRAPPWKLIGRFPERRFELYQVEEDPAESRELSGRQAEHLERMKQELSRLCPEAE